MASGREEPGTCESGALPPAEARTKQAHRRAPANALYAGGRLEQPFEEIPCSRVVDGVMCEPTERLSRTACVGTPRCKKRGDLVQHVPGTAKSAAAFPVDDIDVSIDLGQPGREIRDISHTLIPTSGELA